MAYCEKCDKNVEILTYTNFREPTPKTELRCSNCFWKIEFTSADSQESFNKAKERRFKWHKQDVIKKYKDFLDEYKNIEDRKSFRSFWLEKFGAAIFGSLLFTAIGVYVVFIYQPHFDLNNTLFQGAETSVKIAIYYVRTIIVLFVALFLFGVYIAFVEAKKDVAYNFYRIIERKRIYNQQITEIDELEYSDENYQRIISLYEKEVSKSNRTVASADSKLSENRIKFITTISLGFLILIAIIRENLLVDPLGKVTTVFAFFGFMVSLICSLILGLSYVELEAEVSDKSKNTHEVATTIHNSLFGGLFFGFLIGIAALILAILIAFHREFLIFYNWLAK